MPTQSRQIGYWIAHKADRLNTARALFAPVLLFAPFVVTFPQDYELVYAIAIFLIIGKTNYLLHLHIHRPFSKDRTLNLILDLSMGAVTAMTASNWRIQHLYGHHRGIDLPYRGERIWQMERYSPLRAISFCLISIGTTFTAPFVESFRKGILANDTMPINYRWAFCEHCLLVLFIGAMSWWNPWLVLTYLLPWYGLTHFITRYVDYLNHYGCNEKSESPFEHANNSLSSWFNRTTHNFGYHTAHHIRPGAHWTELPEIHWTIADKIPQQHLKPVSWSFLQIPYHFYLSRTGRM